MSGLELIQRDLGAKLEIEDYFKDIPVFVLREQRVQTMLDKALMGLQAKGGKVGTAVSILMPLLNVDKPNAPGPVTMGSITVRVQEHPDLNMLHPNGCRKPAEEIVFIIGPVLHHFQLIHIAGALTPAKNFVLPNREMLPILTYDMTYEFQYPLGKITKVATPLIVPGTFGAETGDLITLTCATPDAVIYYTEDQSFPSSLNPKAILYTGPFQLRTAYVRAAAYYFGWIGSDINQAEYDLALLGTEPSVGISGEGGGIVVE